MPMSVFYVVKFTQHLPVNILSTYFMNMAQISKVTTVRGCKTDSPIGCIIIVFTIWRSINIQLPLCLRLALSYACVYFSSVMIVVIVLFRFVEE